jgi:hypothetical protein
LVLLSPDSAETNVLHGRRIQAEEIAAENASICETLGTIRGTEKYNQCLLDVWAFRVKVEKRFNDQNEF